MKKKIVLMIFSVMLVSFFCAQSLLVSLPETDWIGMEKSAVSSTLKNPTSFDVEQNNAQKLQEKNSESFPDYASNSVLAQGKFVKIRIAESGVYKLTYEDLNSMGITPANVRIFGYGGAVLNQSLALNKIDDLPESAIWMEKGNDGVFNSGDYILFYAQGVNSWSYDKTKEMFTHRANTYSDAGYYFVTSDAGTGKLIMDKSYVLPDSPTIQAVDEFVSFQVYEKDLVNLINSGKEFYGETFSSVTSYNFPFTFPNSIGANSVKVRLDVASTSYPKSAFTLKLNGEQSQTLEVPASNIFDPFEKAKGASTIFSFTPQSDSYGFTLEYNKSVPASIGYLNYLEVNARRQLKMVGTVMPFQNVDYLGTNVFVSYQLSNVNANIQIWDITDPTNISRMITENTTGKMTFVAPGNEVNHYIAIDPTASANFAKPEILGTVENQNLHGIAQADMVIITHPNFLAPAETLAQAHRQKDNLTVAVVTADQVYNEFSSGTPDAAAYRRLLKMLNDRSKLINTPNTNPKYLLLFGKGSFDNRKLISDSGDNLILTYQADNSLVKTYSYITDDYFAFLDDNEGVNLHSDNMDVGVGRFPVSTVQQANDVVNKTIAYMNNTEKGHWKNNLCFVADDGDMGLHAIQADSLASMVGRSNPGYRINKVYIDAYQQVSSPIGERYPEAKNDLLKQLEAGQLLFNYTGHGGDYFLTFEQILTETDISALTNNRLALWYGATSSFTMFDTKIVSAGERAILNPNGGGIGVFSGARLTYASQNFGLNRAFYNNIFKKVDGKQLRIGDIIRMSKNELDREINKLSFIYLGDPAIKLNYPSPYKVLTTQINNNTVFGTDTLKASSTHTIQGIIADDSGNQITSFNGNLQLELFDKIQRIPTLNNDKEYININSGVPFIFSDRPVALHSGDVPVVDGAFSYSLKMPEEIDTNFGTGRIIYYANDDINNNEAQGYFENFIVGGIGLTDGVNLPKASDKGFTVTNYPNPVSQMTRFELNVENSASIIDVTIEIYDISGRKIKTISQATADNLTWDLSTHSGSKAKAGLYMYRVILKTYDNQIISDNNKLVVI